MELELINSLQGKNIKKFASFWNSLDITAECLLMLLFAFHKKKKKKH